MKKKTFQLHIIFISIFLLAIVFCGLFFTSALALADGADGLIPCGNGNDPNDRCTLCHLVVGFQGLIDYGFKIFVFLALLMLVVAGVIYIVSTGDQGLMGTAKGILKNTLFGFAFVLLAWLLVNTTILILGANVGVDKTEVWNKFTCDQTRSAMDSTTGKTTTDTTGGVGTTGTKSKVAGDKCGYNDLGTCTTIEFGLTKSAVAMCPGSMVRYKNNGSATEPCVGLTSTTSSVICCIDPSVELGTCASKGKCYPGDFSGCTGTRKWVISPEPDCGYDAAKCCEEGSATLGGQCGRNLKGTCMSSTAYVCPSGNNAWSKGTISCGTSLKCCVKENTNLGTCTGKTTKKSGICYSGSLAFTSCPNASEVKDGDDCGFSRDGTLSEYKCCVPK